MPRAARDTGALLDAIPYPLIRLDMADRIIHANAAAEHFLATGLATLTGQPLCSFVPPASPVLATIAQARQRRGAVRVHRVDLRAPNNHGALADIYVAPVTDSADELLVMLEARALEARIDQHASQKNATRSVAGLVSVLAHEVKNPLSGIRGAAQLLEKSASEGDRVLTTLIRDETDRIVRLIERMEMFGEQPPFTPHAVNMHDVLQRVRQLAMAGFAAPIDVVEAFDPSLPPVSGNRDQLIQVFLNLVTNAARALNGKADGRIVLKSEWCSGVHLNAPGSAAARHLPLAFSVIDNGPGLSDDMRDYVFEPFVSGRAAGTGLGLTLVSKIIGEHGGLVEYARQGHLTVFRVLLAPAGR